MYIKLNVLKDQLCAQIYAYSDNEQDCYQLSGSKTYQVKIWHNANSPSLTIPQSELKNYDNDLCVSFHSRIRFKDFCEGFESSKYNDPNCYHYLKHNCADAANFALQLADIRLPIGYIKMTSPAPYVLLRVPSPILTPFDLFQSARRHKLKQLETSNINFKLELAFSAYGFWAKSTKNKEVEIKSETVISEFEKSIKARSHRAEHYLEAIIESTDQLLKTDEIHSKQYGNYVERFRERQSWPYTQAVSQNFNGLMAILILANLLHLAGYEEQNIKNVVFTLVIIATMGPLTKAYIDNKSYLPRNTHETELSKALADFSKTVIGELDSAETEDIQSPRMT
ncbi:hypothetical protein [Legionella jordanis]|uniref:Uncharacterized protein n=1 Tax=Legionella jordanis TaxID=456 RepID=A0A0W0VBE0_9GAMM|nr:hypothetical protein [Legionella jordanis]KTD17434.1 hypothetical protein Ljor_1740 [Legionella jordanis]RMX01802.1 hypothetical protein EAW55_09855 [Legionella jordanis]VEH11544.1 Uncharacterised protein [Legionella jordanis]